MARYPPDAGPGHRDDVPGPNHFSVVSLVTVGPSTCRRRGPSRRTLADGDRRTVAAPHCDPHPPRRPGRRRAGPPDLSPGLRVSLSARKKSRSLASLPRRCNDRDAALTVSDRHGPPGWPPGGRGRGTPSPSVAAVSGYHCITVIIPITGVVTVTVTPGPRNPGPAATRWATSLKQSLMIIGD